jgi:hypothetical protein
MPMGSRISSGASGGLIGRPPLYVLEPGQQREIGHDRDDEECPPLASALPPKKSPAGQVADHGGEEHQQAKLRIPVAIEDVPGDGKPDPSRVLAPKSPEHQVGDRKEGEQENSAVEEHGEGSAPERISKNPGDAVHPHG